MLRRRRRTRNRIAFALLIVVAFVGSDLGARYILLLAAPRLTAQRPLTEIHNIGAHLTDDGYWVMNDYQGIDYHVAHGERLTVGQPDHYTRTIWLFGNSTTFDYYTADADTMASRLQALLNARGYHWRVRNLGVAGMTITGELARLRTTPIGRGDAVIFLDGWMDSWFDGGKCDAQPLAVLDALCRTVGPQFHLQSDPALYWRVASSARAYTQQAGATFCHFVQPVHDAYLLAPAFMALPDEDFVDSVHLNVSGNVAVAHALYDALTLI